MSVFFVTGASRGLGRELTAAALKAGHQVIATARNPKTIIEDDALLPLPFDITDEQQAENAVQAGIERFGRIDVVVNNAGYGLYGSVEETPDADVRALFDTNAFGLLNVVRAVLPTLRAQRSGRLINMSSSAGFGVGAGRGHYASTRASGALHTAPAPPAQDRQPPRRPRSEGLPAANAATRFRPIARPPGSISQAPSATPPSGNAYSTASAQ